MWISEHCAELAQLLISHQIPESCPCCLPGQNWRTSADGMSIGEMAPLLDGCGIWKSLPTLLTWIAHGRLTLVASAGEQVPGHYQGKAGPTSCLLCSHGHDRDASCPLLHHLWQVGELILRVGEKES